MLTKIPSINVAIKFMVIVQGNNTLKSFCGHSNFYYFLRFRKTDICRCATGTGNRYLQMCNRHKEKQISADVQQTQGKIDICRCATDTRTSRYLQMCSRHKEKQISADVQQTQGKTDICRCATGTGKCCSRGNTYFKIN